MGFHNGLPCFPATTSTTGLSVSYYIGGFAPISSAWPITAIGSKMSPAFYIVIGVVINPVALRSARRYGIP